MKNEVYEAFWLGYTNSRNEKVTILCDTEDLANSAFYDMFKDSGQDVKYSVDGVNDLWDKFEQLAATV